MTIKVFDASEFQNVINWPAVVDPGIIRVHNSSRPDNFAKVNIAGARAHCPWRGFYQYLTAGADPVAAAHAFQATTGPLLPGEVAILDLEEGLGDQRARRAAWLAALKDPVEWTYSGVYFARAHLPGVGVEWLAAYGQSEPTDAHKLWQFTNAQSFAGISGLCDGSVFNGTLAQLQALTGTHPQPVPPVVPYIGIPPVSQGNCLPFIAAEIQTRLNAFGYKLVVDSNFGHLTTLAVEDFQRKHHLTIDGIVGALTWRVLFA